MVAAIDRYDADEEFLANVTDIAYRLLLERGLRGSFLDAELELWNRIRAAYQDRNAVEKA